MPRQPTTRVFLHIMYMRHHPHYNMRGCNRSYRHHRGGGGSSNTSNSLSLGYTGTTLPNEIANPFLGYTGHQKGGMCTNASAPSNAADFLGYQKGGMGVPRLINADTFSNAPNLLAQNGGASASVVDGYPKPMPGATINLSDSGSVFTGSNPYLVTRGGRHRHHRRGGSAEVVSNAPDLLAQKGGMAPDIAKAYPSTLGTPTHVNWINNQTLHGGGCGCSTPFFGGRRQRGGRNFGDLVPNGLLGQSWTSNIGTWPGVDGVAMNRGHYDLNTYANDVSRQTQAIGANFPFSGLPWRGGGGSSSRRRRHSRRRTYRHRKMRGGALSNFLSQDIINLGREFGFNVNSAYNALNGAPAPVNPLPWKGQLEHGH